MSERTVLVLSGPNLNLFGTREPEIYGSDTLEDHIDRVRQAASAEGIGVEHLQSASEAELVAAIHGATGRCAAVIINGAALSHYGWSLHDALAAYDGYVVEVHVSNPDRREAWRHTSVITPVADGLIAGFGGEGYSMAIQAVIRTL